MDYFDFLQTRGFLGNPQAELFDWLTCFPRVKGRASDLLVIRKKGMVTRGNQVSDINRIIDVVSAKCVWVCVHVRGRVLLITATAAQLCEDEDDEGALRCVQDSGVLLQRDFSLRCSSFLSGCLQPRHLLSWIHPQPEQPQCRSVNVETWQNE